VASPFASNRAQAVAESVGMAASEAIKTLASYSDRVRDVEAWRTSNIAPADASATTARSLIRSNRR
jgi:hypothetical protein